MVLLAAKAATRAWTARLLTARGMPRLTWWMRAMASSLNRVSAAAGEFEVVADVGPGLAALMPVMV